jgi:hypothetical protein
MVNSLTITRFFLFCEGREGEWWEREVEAGEVEERREEVGIESGTGAGVV